MSRAKNTVRNTVFAGISFLVKILLQFLVRTVFIYTLGVRILGLNSLFANVITLLNVVELGIGFAIVFSMYKPIANGDTEKIKSHMRRGGVEHEPA